MQWVAENWFTILLAVGMVAMHLFGHGHGGHGRRQSRHDKPKDANAQTNDPAE